MSAYLAAPSRLFLHFFFFNDTATPEIYTLSLHDALPISNPPAIAVRSRSMPITRVPGTSTSTATDRKSTRLNSSHITISYAVFCLKKKKKKKNNRQNKARKKPKIRKILRRQ